MNRESEARMEQAMLRRMHVGRRLSADTLLDCPACHRGCWIGYWTGDPELTPWAAGTPVLFHADDCPLREDTP